MGESRRPPGLAHQVGVGTRGRPPPGAPSRGCRGSPSCRERIRGHRIRHAWSRSARIHRRRGSLLCVPEWFDADHLGRRRLRPPLRPRQPVPREWSSGAWWRSGVPQEPTGIDRSTTGRRRGTSATPPPAVPSPAADEANHEAHPACSRSSAWEQCAVRSLEPWAPHRSSRATAVSETRSSSPLRGSRSTRRHLERRLPERRRGVRSPTTDR